MRPAARYLLFGNRLPGLQLGFATDIYSLNGSRYSSFLSLPGATYTRAGAATAETAAGAIINFAANVPRITDRGVLIEEARTNLLLRSAEFDNAAWTATNATISANSIAAPDGTTTADTLVEDTATSTHRSFQSVAVTVSTTYTASVFVKAAGRSQFRLFETSLGGVTFDLTGAGVVLSGTGGSITALANGWFRCAMTVTTTGAQTTFVSQFRSVSGGVDSFTGSGAAALYLWGAQLELGAFPTSYIPTGAAAATRAADTLQTAVSITDSQDFVIYAAASLSGTSPVDQRLFTLDAGGNANRLFVSRTAAGLVGASITVASSVTLTATTSKTGARTLKVAIRRVGTAYTLFVDGVALAASTVASMPTLTAMFDGHGRANIAPLNDYLRSRATMLGTFTDAQCIAMTT